MSSIPHSRPLLFFYLIIALVFVVLGAYAGRSTKPESTAPVPEDLLSIVVDEQRFWIVDADRPPDLCR
jgi:hypothetical protein